MMYKYETHVHSYPASACGNSSPEEVVERYLEDGYSGLWLTDHFFNGNSGVPRDLEWKERVERFCDSYHRAKNRGDELGLEVYFGYEYNHHGAEFLVYGSSPEYLYQNNGIMSRDVHEVLDELRGMGAFIVHAHPYRNASYIPKPGTRYDGHVDAVEVFNACNTPADNLSAIDYARECGLIPFAGSDNHNARHLHHSGIALPERAGSYEGLIGQIRERKHRLLTPGFEDMYKIFNP